MKKKQALLLKDLSQTYLQDAKSLGYKWIHLLKKATRDKVIDSVKTNNFLGGFDDDDDDDDVDDDDDDIFQKENTSIPKYKIISTKNVQNKKFNFFTNEFKIKISKPLNNAKDFYLIFQDILDTVKRKRKLKSNDMFTIIVHNEDLKNPISTKFQKIFPIK